MDFYNNFFLIMFALGCLIGLVALGYVIRRAFGREAGEIGGWELRGGPRRITAVAKTTLAEGLRAKVASGFALLILLSIPLFWLTAEGDGTIKGMVQMFITYSLGFTSFILSLLTIFFSCRSLSVELATRQIYSVASKPIPRWQILAGKWIGIMSLNTILLAIACLATLAGARATVWRFKTHLRHELETYGSLSPAQAATAVTSLDLDHVKGIGREGAESPIVHTIAEALGLTQQQIVDMLLRLPEATRVDLRRFDELRRQVLVARAGVTPEKPDLTEDIEKSYRFLEKEGRLPDDWSPGRIREQIETNLRVEASRVPFGARRTWVFKGPAPPVAKTQRDLVEAGARGDSRTSIMSVRFKMHVGNDLPAYMDPLYGKFERDTLLCAWGIGDPLKPTFFAVVEPYAIRSFTEFEIPVNCVEEDGTVRVEYANIDPRRVDVILDLWAVPSNLEVLYRVGSFELNVFQVFLAVLIPIACLTSLGVCASTFLSFPVGSLIVITLFIITSSMGFVKESLAVTEEYVPPHLQDFKYELRRGTVDAIGWILSIGDCDPVSQLREGRAVGWRVLWESFWEYVLVKSAAVMLVGLLVFRRRELAAVVV
ncbi:MAG: ABC transporter permease [Phycisphaerae bacterium]|nr:ABC transporter permease [Phycisphaerae bacterium]